MEAQGSTVGPRYCYRHPDRETGLSCSECDRPICYECMTPAPVGLRCPEHSGKAQGIQKVTQAAERVATGSHARRVNVVTMTLIGLNLLVYAAELAAGGTINGLNTWIYEHGVLIANGIYQDGRVNVVDHNFPIPAGYETAGVKNGEWWRLVTSTFMHYGPIHLALNMYSLYFAGTILEQVIGRWRFALLYFVSGLAGSAGALFWSPNAMTVGASGAIFGLFGALFVLERSGTIHSGGQIAGLLVMNLLFTFVLSSYLSVGGHVGGLIGGFILMTAFVRFRRSTALSLAAAGGVAAAVLVFAFATI